MTSKFRWIHLNLIKILALIITNIATKSAPMTIYLGSGCLEPSEDGLRSRPGKMGKRLMGQRPSRTKYLNSRTSYRHDMNIKQMGSSRGEARGACKTWLGSQTLRRKNARPSSLRLHGNIAQSPTMGGINGLSQVNERTNNSLSPDSRIATQN